VRLDDTFPAVPLGVSAIRRAVAEVAQACGLDAAAVANVRLAVSEAATNAVLHAYRDRTGSIRMTAEVVGSELRVVVADDGPGVLPRRDSPGVGLGLRIIARVTERVEVVSRSSGAEIHLFFACPPAGAAASA
jgi:serine/threonine-protein kinase RsbW/stage II sporulation protein AB (anti-sigma F factor)